MSFEKPPLAKYIEPSSKAVDLVNLCRRLIAESQYWDPAQLGNFVKVSEGRNPATSQSAFEAFRKRFPWVNRTEMIPFIIQSPTTKYSVNYQYPGDYPWTAKDFKSNDAEKNLKPEELLEIYWQMRMFSFSGFITVTIGQLVEEFRKLEYDGFLLPNGKVVSFDSMHLTTFWFTPKALHLIDYRFPTPKLPGSTPPTPWLQVIPFQPVEEGVPKFDSVNGFQAQNIVMAFNLPELDEDGCLGRLMIIDPTCAQFGMKGTNDELVYWGYYEDYVKAFPGKQLFFVGDKVLKFFKYDYIGIPPISALRLQMCLPPLKKAALSNMNSDFCGYCGEVEREDNPKTKLKKCAKCKAAFYCDGLCQKLAWKGHKLECKSN